MNSPLLTALLVMLFNRYPIKLAPSFNLDFAGRYINTYQILSHIPPGLMIIGLKKKNSTDYFSPTMFVYNDDDVGGNLLEFLLSDVLDFIGWLAIFSRLKRVPLLPKTLANTHMASAIISSLGHETFKDIYLKTSNYFYWNLFRTTFILGDAVLRGYYHFYVLRNI